MARNLSSMMRICHSKKLYHLQYQALAGHAQIRPYLSPLFLSVLRARREPDPDNLLLGEPTGDPFDIAMGQMCRGMLLKTVERLMKN